MRLLATLVLLGALSAACSSAPDRADVELLHEELDLLGGMGRAPIDLTPAELLALTKSVPTETKTGAKVYRVERKPELAAGVVVCVTSAHAVLDRIAPRIAKPR